MTILNEHSSSNRRMRAARLITVLVLSLVRGDLKLFSAFAGFIKVGKIAFLKESLKYKSNRTLSKILFSGEYMLVRGSLKIEGGKRYRLIVGLIIKN